MLERDGFPPGVPCWIDTTQPDPDAAVAFYGGLFGWEFEDRMPDGAPGRYYMARLRGRDVAAVGSQPEGAASPAVWNTYIGIANADDTSEKVTEAGGQVVEAPFDVFDAGRMAIFADPTGAVFCAWQPGRHAGAQLVNEPGTWNWSDLQTSEPEAAKAFYGAVFGWEMADMGGGTTMMRLPGYGEFLAARDPDLRERHAQEGVPEGFSDAIGWMAPIGEDESAAGTGSHWSVTFAVADTDAVTDRAVGLGATIVVPPFDVDVVRMAVLRDPQGAVFTLSRYGPAVDAAG